MRRAPAHPKRYRLGDQALLLGMAMQGRDHIRDRARPSLVRLAAASGDTVLLSTRLFAADGRPGAAISIAALSVRITSRLPVLVKALQQEAAALSANEAQLEAA